MANTEGALHVRVREAATKFEGKKFCFACQNPKDLAKMKMVSPGRWRCTDCLTRMKGRK